MRLAALLCAALLVLASLAGQVLAQDPPPAEVPVVPISWSEWLNAAIPLLLLVCAWLARGKGKLAKVAAVLVRVIEDREDPALKQQAKAEAERAGVQPALAPIVKRETTRMEKGGAA